MEEIARAWGGNIERGRSLLGLTQVQLATIVGVSQPTIAKWENGRVLPRDLHKVRLAQALRQDVRSLFPLVAGAA